MNATEATRQCLANLAENNTLAKPQSGWTSYKFLDPDRMDTAEKEIPHSIDGEFYTAHLDQYLCAAMRRLAAIHATSTNDPLILMDHYDKLSSLLYDASELAYSRAADIDERTHG